MRNRRKGHQGGGRETYRDFKCFRGPSREIEKEPEYFSTRPHGAERTGKRRCKRGQKSHAAREKKGICREAIPIYKPIPRPKKLGVIMRRRGDIRKKEIDRTFKP